MSLLLPSRSTRAIYSKARRMGLFRSNRYGERDIAGLRSGKLTAIEPTKMRHPDNSVIWLCRCDCGNEKLYPTYYITGKQIKSCGCVYKVSDQGNVSALLRTYKSLAKKRGLVWGLSRTRFNYLIRLDCEYCGSAPSQKVSSSSRNNPLVYNGVDRVDPQRGYEINNCVPCCKHCNQSKWTNTVEEWTAHMKLVLSYVNRS